MELEVVPLSIPLPSRPGSSSGIDEFAGTDRFKIERRLGEGGMGVVYAAYDRERRTHVAIKTLRRAEPQLLYRFKREFRSIRDTQHPNLVNLGELFEDRGHWFFTMELIDGVDLLTYLRGAATRTDLSQSDDTLRATRATERLATNDGLFDEARTRDALRQLALGLAAIHDAGKVHRDIKPSNILVDRDGRVVLLDFGLVFDPEQNMLSDDTATVGTAEYMAPEQAASGRIGPAADWYSMGVICYQVLTGRLPFAGSGLSVMIAKQQHTPDPPRSVVPNVPADLDELTTQLLRFDPLERPSRSEIFRRLKARPDRASSVGPATASTVTTFVGRETELDHLDHELGHVLGGGTAAVLVGGASGLGKSALMRYFAERAKQTHPSLVVLRGRCYEREAVPFKAFDGIIDSLARYIRNLPDSNANALLPRDASLLPRMFPALGRVEAIARAPVASRQGQRHDLRARTFTALRELLARIADRNPLVVMIDDLQWADADSLVLLAELLRPAEAPRMLLLTSSRAEAEWVTPARFTEIAPGRSLILRVRPLSIEASVDLARRLAIGAGITLDVQAIADEARGHPLHLYELVRHAQMHAGRPDAPRPGRLRLEEAIVARAAQLPEPAGGVLELIALAAAPIAERVLRTAARLQTHELDRALGLLRTAQLVRMSGEQHLEPAHDRVREAVAAAISAPRRRTLHERLAIALEVEGGRPELLVRHLEAANQRRKAAQYGLEAARRAHESLAFDRAVDLFQTALRLGDYDANERRALLLELGDALSNASRGPEAAGVYAEALEGADPDVRLECRRQIAEHLVTSGHIDSGLEALEMLLGELGVSLPKTPNSALRSLLWHQLKLRMRGMRWQERRASQVPPDALLRIDAYKTASHSLAMVEPVRGADFSARYLLLALRTGEITRIVRALGLEIAICGSQSRSTRKRAHKLVRVINSVAEREDDPYIKGWALASSGAVQYFDGTFQLAADTLERATTQFLNQARGASWEIMNTRMVHLFALRQLGRLAEFGVRYEQMVRDASARGDLYVETSARRYCNLVWLARNDVDAARANLGAAVWMPPEGRFHLQHWFELEATTEVAMYEGSVDQFDDARSADFHALERSLLPRVQIVRSLSRFARGRLILATPNGDLDLVSKIIRQQRREKMGFATVFSWMLQAGLERRRGNPEAAVEALRTAITHADRQHMGLAAAVARWQLGVELGADEGQALVRQAEGWMFAEEIQAPARMVGVFLPGFDPR